MNDNGEFGATVNHNNEGGAMVSVYDEGKPTVNHNGVSNEPTQAMCAEVQKVAEQTPEYRQLDAELSRQSAALVGSTP